MIDAILDKQALPPDLIHSLVSGIGANAFCKALELLPTYNQSLQQMAKYYFEAKGGKLIRPTVSLLMSAACNRQSDSRAPGSRFREEPFVVLASRLWWGGDKYGSTRLSKNKGKKFKA